MAVSALGFSNGAAPSATVTVPVPSGVALGDLLLIWVISQAAGMTFSDTGDGFTAVTATSGHNCSYQMLYRTATSADVTLSAGSGSYTVTASVSHMLAGIIVDAPGASFDPSTPVSSGQGTASSGTSFTVSSITTTSSGDLLLAFGGSRFPTGNSGTITLPSGFSTTVTQVSSSLAGGTNVGAMLATLTQSAAGATGTTAWGLGSALDDGGGLMVPLTQAAGGTNAPAGLASASGAALAATGPGGGGSGIGTPYTVVAAQEATAVTTTSYQVTVTATTTAGDCIAVFVSNNNSAVTGVTDSKSNIYVLASSDTGQNLKSYAYIAAYGPGGSGTPTAVLTSGTDTITAAYTSAAPPADVGIIARACSGIVNTSPADANGTANADSAASAAPAVTGTSALAQASEWVIAMLQSGSGSGSPSAWSGSFTQAAQVHLSGAPYITWADEIVSATTAQAASCTITSAKWSLLQVALKAAAASGTSATAGLVAATGVPGAPAPGISLGMTIQGV